MNGLSHLIFFGLTVDTPFNQRIIAATSMQTTPPSAPPPAPIHQLPPHSHTHYLAPALPSHMLPPSQPPYQSQHPLPLLPPPPPSMHMGYPCLLPLVHSKSTIRPLPKPSSLSDRIHWLHLCQGKGLCWAWAQIPPPQYRDAQRVSQVFIFSHV